MLSIADLPLENTIPESFRIGIVQVSRVSGVSDLSLSLSASDLTGFR